MEVFVVCAAALVASALTLFSGFGLGTLLMPVFAIFFPVPTAIALTAVVHFLNNLFKLALLGRHADWGVSLRFGVPAVAAAFLGALTLQWLSGLPPLAQYELFGSVRRVEAANLVVAVLMIGFALFEVVPRLQNLSIDRKFLPLGGMLSGFFGGVSGHQGALRSAFLLRCGLGKEAFIATGVTIACLVDVTRIAVYSVNLSAALENAGILAAAAASALTGALVGARLMKKVTLQAVRWIVAAMLAILAVALVTGLV